MNPKILHEPLKVFFSASQWGLKPLRTAGLMGTSEAPQFYAAGDPVPWWLECRWPLSVSVTFSADVETFWQDGEQHVFPLRDDFPLISVSGAGCSVLLVGAPTCLHPKPRTKPPKHRKATELSFA